MKEYNIAIYIRLSIADEDAGTSKAESDSIPLSRNAHGLSFVTMDLPVRIPTVLPLRI